MPGNTPWVSAMTMRRPPIDFSQRLFEDISAGMLSTSSSSSFTGRCEDEYDDEGPAWLCKPPPSLVRPARGLL